ncbi:MAG: FAD-binding oxidoreductase [Solirubrobacteraceae bacterium]
MIGSMADELAHLLGDDSLVSGSLRSYGSDATKLEGLVAAPEGVVAPGSAEGVALLVDWAYRNDVPLVTRGGGTGLAGGAVPVHGELVVDISRLNRVRALDPGLWRMHAEAGLTTATVHRLARENGLYFPPDPGASEQSQLGGNIATNAGGPHAFKYGVTGAWVTGIEAAIPPGELVRVGGPVRKDVAGYDLKSLLIGSEGTLGIITAAWLRLIPAPESRVPVVAGYEQTADGCAAIEAILASGVVPAAIEFIQGAAVDASRGSFPLELSNAVTFLVIAEVDGKPAEIACSREELRAALETDSAMLWAPESSAEAAAVWRWREGVSLAVAAERGGKVSEDIAVPLDRLSEAIDQTVEIGKEVRLPACSWGHAGDGNIHSTFLIDATDPEDRERAQDGGRRLHELAVQLGGSISGEHGIGWQKRGRLALQWGPRALELHGEIKRVFDPKNLMNPGKKT